MTAEFFINVSILAMAGAAVAAFFLCIKEILIRTRMRKIQQETLDRLDRMKCRILELSRDLQPDDRTPADCEPVRESWVRVRNKSESLPDLDLDKLIDDLDQDFRNDQKL